MKPIGFRRSVGYLLVALAMLAVGCAEPVLPLVAAPATVTPIPTPTPTPGPTPIPVPTTEPLAWLGEPGITEDLITIGVIYDVGVDPVSDQLAWSAVEAVQAWAMAINREGGLAARSVEVLPIPTRPLLADHAAAIDIACNSGVFALVGSAALFDADGLDQLTGTECSLPDFPSIASSTERLNSSVTTVSNPITSNLWQAGWASYWLNTSPFAAAASAVMLVDGARPISVISGQRTIEAASKQGYEFVYREEIAFDTDFTEEVRGLEDAGAQLLTWRSDGGRLIRLLEALDAAELGMSVIDCGQVCYSREWVEAAGPLGEGVSVWLPTLPLEEADVTPELNRYLFWLDSSNPDAVPTSLGIMAWSSALLFEEAVNIALGAGSGAYDPDNITRQFVLDAADQVIAWDARGLQGVANPAARTPSSCFTVLTLRDGQWERAFPERRGEFDCAPENLVRLVVTSGIESAPTPTPLAGFKPDTEDIEFDNDG